MADPKAKDAPKRLNLEARFDVASPEVQGPTESRGSTLYSDRGDKPPVADGPAKPGAAAAPKSVSDLAYGSAEPLGALAARTALTRDKGGAEALAKILQDHPTDRAAILREVEAQRGAAFAAEVAIEKTEAPDLKKQDERGTEIQRGAATEKAGETSEDTASAGVHQVQQVDTQMTE